MAHEARNKSTDTVRIGERSVWRQDDTREREAVTLRNVPGPVLQLEANPESNGLVLSTWARAQKRGSRTLFTVFSARRQHGVARPGACVVRAFPSAGTCTKLLNTEACCCPGLPCRHVFLCTTFLFGVKQDVLRECPMTGLVRLELLLRTHITSRLTLGPLMRALAENIRRRWGPIHSREVGTEIRALQPPYVLRSGQGRLSLVGSPGG